MREETKWTAVLCVILVIGFGALFAIANSEPAECKSVDIQQAPQTVEFIETVHDQKAVVQESQAERIAEIAAAEAAARAAESQSYSSSYSNNSGDHLTRSGGVYYYNGRKETWYSQRVLPGGGLDIPGRHVNAEDGTIRDEDGYICVAASDLEYGTVVETSLGTGKVYDTGCAPGTTDIYVDW